MPTDIEAPQDPHYIYVITNVVNDKVYVGKTCSPVTTRWQQHLKHARTKDRIQYLHRAIRKHGENSFQIQTVAVVRTSENAFNLERAWIAVLQSADAQYGYNLTHGGEGGRHNETVRARLSADAKARGQWYTVSPRLGKKHSLASRAKISQNRKGKQISQVGLENLRASVGKGEANKNYGRKRSPETCLRISAARTGMKLSDAARRNIGLASARRRHSEETKTSMSASRTGKGNPMFGVVGEANKKYKQEISADTVRVLRSSGMTILAIAKHFKVSRNVVYLRLGKRWT